MSFLKKFEELALKRKDGKTSDGHPQPQPGYGAQPAPPNQYGAPPGYPQPPYGQQPYGPPPPHSYPPPPLPEGWSQHWEHNTQRAYFFQHTTGQSQWDPPFHQQHGHYPAMGGGGYPPYQQYAGGYPPQQYGDAPTSGHKVKKEKKGHSSGAMVGAGAAGLAVGVVGGAIIADGLGDDGDSHPHPEEEREIPSDASSSGIEDLQEAEEEVYGDDDDDD